jgi:3D-(3,5/4)-trihydroxycyclohexane-1,2-dione acylhydrolase (decyclizing)
MPTTRLTAAQALVRYLAAQHTEIAGTRTPLFAAMWAIFGHGNVAGLGEALYAARDKIPTYRGHNEQGMALAAVAFAKASFRRRMMACTTSIGPGATNMITAAAVAHVNRLPVLFLPSDVFASRRPDPVLQQVENFADATVSANDCFRPVSRYFDRITRPEQILGSLPRAMAVLTDPAECGPVTLSFCQDVQAEAFDYPDDFFADRLWLPRRPRPDARELAAAVALLRAAQSPLIIAGGGVLYADATAALATFADAHGIPVAETQAGKGALPWDHPLNLGAVGVTGTAAANRAAAGADVILAIGTRLADFTTGSWTLFAQPDRKIIGLNMQPFDATKHHAHALVCDAREGLAALAAALATHRTAASWTAQVKADRAAWFIAIAPVTAPTNTARPSDAQVIGAVQRTATSNTILLAAAGGLPGELHKLWHAQTPGSYHLEYGYSTMGYEIAGGLGTKLARPDADVVVMLGDGSYLMMNSELATSVMLGAKITVVLLDNGGFGCIDRLQRGTGNASFNNLLATAHHETLPAIDFCAHAESLGAIAERVASIADLEAALARARTAPRSTVIVIDTDPAISTDQGGHWWDVAVPQVSTRAEVNKAHDTYLAHRGHQRLGQ